jgi:hypothetical protein
MYLYETFGIGLRMGDERGMKKRIICFIMSCLLIMIAAFGQGNCLASTTPGFSASVTQDNIMALLDAYDSDGAYIMRCQIKAGDDITSWWKSSGETTIVGELDTAVHEECHEYMFNTYPGSNGETIYTGNKNKINVTYTDVYPSKEMAATIPSNLRTFRYSTYVGNPTENLASNVTGIYGLLNEFSAYYWGMHSEMQMYDYFVDNNASVDLWTSYIQQCVSDELAYAEFKYYMLKYMTYAKSHYPDIYTDIMGNEKLKAAYTIIESKFAAQIKKFNNQLSDIAGLINKKGTKAEYTGNELRIYKTAYSYTIYSVKNDEYEKLIKELNKTSYKKMAKLLSNVSVKSTGLSTVKNKAGKKLSLSWKKSSGATGYQIQYSTKSSFSSYKTKNVTGTSVVLSKLTKGKKYYIRVRAYKTIGGKKFYSSWSKVKTRKITK